MHRKIYLIFVILTISALSTANDNQNNWWGGPGTPGPLFNWSSYFHLSADLVWREYSVVFLEKNPRITVDSSCSWPACVSSSDIDGDGDIDLIGAVSGAHAGSDDVLWWENLDGDGSNWGEFIIEGSFDGAISVVSEDIDGDGTNDVIASAFADGSVYWWANTAGAGAEWDEHLVDDDFYMAQEVAAADVDGDGDFDIMCTSWFRDEIAWWENADGIGETWIKHIIGSNLLGTRCVVTCDVNGDGYLDVIGAAINENEVYWWENLDGSGTVWVEHTILSSVAGPYAIQAGDIDGDSDIDVAVGLYPQPPNEPELIWCINDDGSGNSWSMNHISYFDLYSQPWDIEIADLDGDEDSDIGIALCSSGGDLCWLENLNGSGFVWAEHPLHQSANDPVSVNASDLNGDGEIDLASVYSAGGEVVWWDIGDEYPPSGWLESSVLDSDSSPDYHLFSWVATEPPGTSVSFQFRSSNDPGAMGSWSVPITSNPVAIDSVIDDWDRYFQYRAVFETSQPDATPILNSVFLAWSFLGIEHHGEEEQGILSFPANPATGSVFVEINCSEPLLLSLTVYDVCGRSLATIEKREYSEGVERTLLGEYSPGIYMCAVTAEGLLETRRFVVIK